jgi:hypothetical protein
MAILADVEALLRRYSTVSAWSHRPQNGPVTRLPSKTKEKNMAKYLFVYHGGKRPESEAEVAKVLDAWGNWLGSMGSAVVDGGNPVGKSTTVKADGSVKADGGSNPASGYGIFEAKDEKDAVAKAKGCPILTAGGSVELAAIIDM